MSNYMFAPCAKFNDVNHAYWEKGFSVEEIDSIIKYGDGLILDKASLAGKTVNEKVRNSKTGWIASNEQTGWLYDRLAFIARSLNSQYFNFDLYGFSEDFQYTVYEGNDEHYDWHMDKGGSSGFPQRKLSLVLQLSEDWEYEGGNLEFKDGPETFVAKKEKGLVYAFPSYLLHRVTPVTAGVRKSLVVWIGGPAFR